MKWHRHNTDTEQRKLFAVENRNGVVVLSFCGEARDLLGMDLAMINQLWDFFSEQEQNPAKAIVLNLPPSVFGPLSMDTILALQSVQVDRNIGNTAATRAVPDSRAFAREITTMRRFIEAVTTIEAFVIITLSGSMALPLLGPALACDFRVVSNDFILVNRMRDYGLLPLGGLPWFLTRIMGRKAAAEIIREEKRISAEEAVALGLVERVVPEDRLLDASVDLAREIARHPYGLRASLKQTTVTIGESLEGYLEREPELFTKSLTEIRAMEASD
jgi:enoyl-CoA hydratase/carnithine racemase